MQLLAMALRSIGRTLRQRRREFTVWRKQGRAFTRVMFANPVLRLGQHTAEVYHAGCRERSFSTSSVVIPAVRLKEQIYLQPGYSRG